MTPRRDHQDMRAYLAAALTLLALTACSSTSDGDTAAATPSPTVSNPPADGGQRKTPEAIVEVLRGHGLDCHGLRPPAEPPVDGTTKGGCDTPSAERIWVTIYPDPAVMREEVQALATIGIRMSMLVGQNWTVAGDDGFVEKARYALGGEVIRSAAG